MWLIFEVIKAILNFCSKICTMQYCNGPQCNTIIFSLCNITLCYKLHEISTRADQLLYSLSSRKGVLDMHIKHHKCEDISAQHQNIWLIVWEVIFKRNVFCSWSKSYSGSKYRYLNSLNQPKSNLSRFGLTLWDTQLLINVQKVLCYSF